MRSPVRIVATIAVVLAPAFLAPACSTKQPAEKTGAAPEAPLSAGYESAIVAHASKPIFRPAGTAPAVWGPGDLYNLLATGD